MKTKFGTIEFRDWFSTDSLIVVKESVNLDYLDLDGDNTYIQIIQSSFEPQTYWVYFSGRLEFLQDTYDAIADHHFASMGEAQEYADAFLVRMATLETLA